MDDQLMRSSLLKSSDSASPKSNLISYIIIFIVFSTIFLGGFFLGSYTWNPNAKSSSSDSPAQKSPKNLILFVGDGFGPSHMVLAREYQRARKADPSLRLSQEDYLVGLSRTKSYDSLVTDSAAGATAFSCAIKADNGNVSVNPVGIVACPTFFEAAARQKYLTGLVSTSRVTHATPAAFSSHVTHRDNENYIAEQQIANFPKISGSPLQVLFGGGKRHFLPNTTAGSCRQDSIDLIQSSIDQGFDYVSTPDELAALSRVPALGLFANDHLDFDIDRDPKSQPSLAEMAKKAIDLLNTATKNSNGQNPGWVLMVEGSRIDMASHVHDTIAMVRDVVAFQDAWTVAKDFALADGNTLVVGTADHETGGLTLQYQYSSTEFLYEYSASPLVNITNSTTVVAEAIYENRNNTEYVEKTIIPLWMGITDVTDDELAQIYETAPKHHDRGKSYASTLMIVLTKMITQRCLIGYSTFVHTGTDVGIYALGPKSDLFRGEMENTNIGALIQSIFNFDLSALNDKVKEIPLRNSDPTFKC